MRSSNFGRSCLDCTSNSMCYHYLLVREAALSPSLACAIAGEADIDRGVSCNASVITSSSFQST